MFATSPCRPLFFIMLTVLPNTLSRVAPLCFYISFNICLEDEVQGKGTGFGILKMFRLSFERPLQFFKIPNQYLEVQMP